MKSHQIRSPTWVMAHGLPGEDVTEIELQFLKQMRPQWVTAAPLYDECSETDVQFSPGFMKPTVNGRELR